MHALWGFFGFFLGGGDHHREDGETTAARRRHDGGTTTGRKKKLEFPGEGPPSASRARDYWKKKPNTAGNSYDALARGLANFKHRNWGVDVPKNIDAKTATLRVQFFCAEGGG